MTYLCSPFRSVIRRWKGYKLKVGWNSGSPLIKWVFLKKKYKILKKNLEFKFKPPIFAPAFEMRAKVDWNNEEQVQFISTKKRVQALISLEKFISTGDSGQARHIKI